MTRAPRTKAGHLFPLAESILMTTMKNVLESKGTQVHTIESSTSVFDAIKKMEEANVGSLLVMDGQDICGIVTERDYLRQVILKGRSSKTTPVADIMTSNVCCAHADDTVEDGLAMMTKIRCRHLPIVDENGLAGLVSIGDLVKRIVQDREAEIRQLNDYIQGKYPG